MFELSRLIGGGILDGEDVALYIDDKTGIIDMLYMGEHQYEKRSE